MPFPSAEQSRVIAHRGSPLVVVAGPGTGKTRTLVERMIGLLREDQAREVTFITFTRTSRRDTEQKLADALGDQAAQGTNLMFPRTATLHTYAKRLTHRFSYVIGREPAFSILIEGRGERALLVAEIHNDLAIEVSRARLSTAISHARATSEWSADCEIPLDTRPHVLGQFDQLLRLYNTFDMQGLVLAASVILQSEEGAIPRIFLQVDEYQDLNPSDQQLVALLASHPASQIVVVGDDAQSIYGFRDANYLGIRDLWASDEWQRIRFPDSHRLASHLLEASIALIHGRDYLGAELNHKPPSDKAITVLQCTSPHLQAEAIARDIEARFIQVANAGALLPHLGDFLVLCPTTDQVQAMVAALNDQFGIPAHAPIKPTIPEVCWPPVLLLRVAADDDPLALRQWLPLLGVTPNVIQRLRDHALGQQAPFARTCYAARIREINRFHTAVLALREQASTAQRLIHALSAITGSQVPDDLQHHLDAVTLDNGELPRLPQLIHRLYESYGVLDPEDSVPDQDRVLVATMHSAKGLEAEYIYCPWLNSVFMPMAGRDVEEQRRVLYVALTRARKDVLITFPEAFDASRGYRLRQEAISPFLAEITAHLRILRTTADDVRATPLPWFIPEVNAA